MNASIEHLAALWASIDKLCSDLTEEEWKRPTGCPGWSVQDQLSHLIDYESRAVGRAAPEHVAADTSHTKNPLGESNEVGIDWRRSRSGTEVLDEFRSVTTDRLAQLQALTDADLAKEITTPAGPGTVADMLTLRVMDTWSHEQDMRRALSRPGHTEGPAADEAVRYFSQYIPLVVAKRAGAPDGSTVVIELGDRPPLVVAVNDGRGAVADAVPDDPTALVRMPVATFAAVVGGRSDPPDDIEVAGDQELGGRVVAGLSFMP
jgi:uncharacterized protein (TIGR03083 family)